MLKVVKITTFLPKRVFLLWWRLPSLPGLKRVSKRAIMALLDKPPSHSGKLGCKTALLTVSRGNTLFYLIYTPLASFDWYLYSYTTIAFNDQKQWFSVHSAFP